ncbi:MAG: hypothetical protein GX092_01900 [Clostridia bacterium]|jgi:ABC-type microcin C transport system permease subunit YejB|nr:hypothetical protein [Clostridia bacterium]
MIIVIVTKWKRKLLLMLAALFFVISLSMWLTETAPTGNLEEDILNQPVKVQGEAGLIP